jgi:GxxExxY protein
MADIIHKDESYKIMGACYEVYKEKGCGFLEQVYQECLRKEFALQKIPFREKPRLNIYYKGEPLKQYYEPDFLCYEKVIVEIKAVEKINDNFKAQVINYLKSTGLHLGILVNFGHYPQLESERLLN